MIDRGGARRAAVAALVIGLAGCAAGPERTRFEARSAPVRRAADSLRQLAREVWHLPLRVRAFLSNAAHGRALAPAAAAREERLVVAQLAEVSAAYRRSPFDLFAVDVTVDPALEQAEVRMDGDALHLAVALPAPPAGADAAPEVVRADALLDVWTDAYRWQRGSRWYLGERSGELAAALRRDLAKLAELHDALDRECHRLEMLAAGLQQRMQASDRRGGLTPSETDFARGAQFRATHALNRALNTLARWRLGAEDPALSLRREAALAALYAVTLVDGYLDRLLDVLVGGRPLARVWAPEWRHRNPLYVTLDAAAEVVPLGEGAEPGRIPAGSVRALLQLRLDGDLGDALEQAEAARERAAAAREGPLAEAARAVWARLPAASDEARRDRLSGFRAWKELWDARLKDGLTLPFNEAVEAIGTFLGDTRWASPPPAIDDDTLGELAALLEPGDVLLVRQELFLSNAFLPGFWTHALLYLGPSEGWTRLRTPAGTPLAEDPLVRRLLPRYERADDHGDALRVIEAVSEGVVFNSLEHAAQKDYVVVLRPQVDEAFRAAALRRALVLHGRPYDFEFDFVSDGAIVCTELVYRAFEDAVRFRLAFDAPADRPVAIPGVLEVMGRPTLPANELARYALYMADHPEPRPEVGYPGARLEVVCAALREPGGGATLHTGDAALEALRGTVDR